MKTSRYRVQLSKARLLVTIILAATLYSFSTASYAAPGDVLFTDNFERTVATGGSNTAGAVGTAPGYGAWTVGPLGTNCAGVTGNTGCAGIDSDIPPFSTPSNARANSSKSMFTRWSLTTADTPVINLAGKPGATVSFWLRRGSDCFSEWPSNNLTGCNGTVPPFTPSTGEEFQVQYKNSASTWVTIAQYAMDDPPGEIVTPTITLPANALWSGFQLRFRQPGGSGSNATTGGAPGVRGYDYWHLDDVVIKETAAVSYTGPFCDTFEADLSRWNAIGTGNARIGSTHFANGAHNLDLRWSNITASSLATNLSGGTGTNTITYWAKRGTGSVTTVPNTTGSDLPDAGENLTVDYLTNTDTWSNLATYTGGGTAGQVFNGSFAIPANAKLSAFSLRFALASGSGLDQDYWHIDNVCVGASLPSSDLGVTQSRSGALVPGQNASYTITATNTGPDTTTGTITVIDTLPTGLSYVSYTGTGWTCNASGQTVTCTHASGSSIPSLTLTVAVSAVAAGAVTNTISISNSSTVDANLSNNTSTDTYVIVPTPYAYYTLDQTTWNGTAGEVIDSSGNNHNGTALNGIGTVTAPASGSKGNTCRAGSIPADSTAGTIKAINTGVDLNNVGNAGTISFWYKSNTDWDNGNNADDRVLLDASGSSTTEFWLMLRKDGSLRYSLDDSTAQRQRTTSAKYTTVAGTWVHLAVTWDFNTGTMDIFRNGVSVAQRTGMTDANGDPSSTNTGWGLLHIGDTIAGVPASYSANGTIDELRIYTVAMTATQILADANAAHSCSCTLGSFRLTQAATALACPDTRAAVTVEPLCADGTTLKNDFAGTVSLSTAPSNASAVYYTAATGGSTTSSVTFASGELSKSAYLYYPNEASVCAVATDGTVTSTSASCTSFHAYGFNVSSQPTDMSCGATSSTTLSLTAYGRIGSNPGCSVITGFSGNKNIKAWFTSSVDPDSPTTPQASNRTLSITGSASGITDKTEPASANLSNINFSAGVATLTLSYPNAAKILGINFKHDASPYNGTAGASSAPFGALTVTTNPFVIYPNSFALTVTDSGSDCAAGDISCAIFKAAGSSFNMKLQALCGDGSTATDYINGNNATPLTVDTPIVAPVTGSAGGLGTTSASISTGGEVAFAETWSEVGVIKLKASPPAWFGHTFTPVLTGNIGRFVPHHFTVTPGTVINRALADCSTPPKLASTFTYAGEEMQVQDFRLTAYNGLATPSVTKNYTGSFARFNGSSNGSFGFAAIDLATATAFDNGSTAGQFNLVSSSISWPTSGPDLGVGTATANLRLNRATTPDGPYESFRIGIEPVDADLVTILAADKNLDITAPADSVNDKVLIGSSAVRFGRLRLSNTFGSGPLQMPVTLQYWSGNTWVLNSDDACSVIPLTAVNSSSNSVAPSCVSAPINYCNGTNLSFINGQSFIRLTPNVASVSTNICVDLGATVGTVCNATSSNQTFLQGRWPPGATYNNDPAAQATFGIFSPETRRTIHVREQF